MIQNPLVFLRCTLHPDELGAHRSITLEDFQVTFIMLRAAVNVIGAANAVLDRAARVCTVGRDAAGAGRRADGLGIGTDNHAVRRRLGIETFREYGGQYGTYERENEQFHHARYNEDAPLSCSVFISR